VRTAALSAAGFSLFRAKGRGWYQMPWVFHDHHPPGSRVKELLHPFHIHILHIAKNCVIVEI
jgi:hypothetical protein